MSNVSVRKAPRWTLSSAVAFLLLLSLVGLSGCSEKAPEAQAIDFSGPTMGTSYSVKIKQMPQGIAYDQVAQGIAGVLKRVNDVMSTYQADSELSRFNQSSATSAVAASDELLKVVAEAQRISSLSDGAFDVTVGPLVNLWGFGPDMRLDRVPSAAEIEQMQGRVGYKKLTADPAAGQLSKTRAELYVDLSAIANEVQAQQLIPAPIPEIAEGDEQDDLGGAVYEYEPSEEAILEDLLPRNISVQIYRALLENSASEHGARMAAMDNATRNAGERINSLTLTYNRTRQAMITNELIEIISGAEAL